MTISLPSKEVYVVDVPEVKGFTTRFQYSYFVPDEQLSEKSGYSSAFLEKKLDYIDESTFNKDSSRFPRYTTLTWKKPHINDYGNSVDHTSIANNVFGGSRSKTLISDNYDKIVYEDIASSRNFVNVNYTDTGFDKKFYELVSGSYQLFAGDNNNRNASNNISILEMNDIIPDVVDRSSVSSAFSNHNLSSGVEQTRNNSAPHTMPDMNLSVQHNSRTFRRMITRNVQDPFSYAPFDASRLNQAVVDQQQYHANDELENKTIIPYIDIQQIDSTSAYDNGGAQIVGYVIEKRDISNPQKVIDFKPIIVESEKIGTVYDPYVKYGSTYQYAIRTIAIFKLPAIDVDSEQVATITVLISSKPSISKIVAHDTKAPPPPVNLDFSWNFDSENLLIHWSFPVNPQRDIKKFQVFRRKQIEHPFELIKEYNFDDSIVKAVNRENPRFDLVKMSSSPTMYYVDDDFSKTSSYVYTVCSIDAHGLTSCYGEQFQMTFNVQKNKLVKTLISHSGAPKQYPNLYVEGTVTKDVATISGNYTKNMQLYFVPQHYDVIDSTGRNIMSLATNQNAGFYKFNFINIDNQKSKVLTVKIDDKRKSRRS